jgi:hypothetical protein
MSQIFRQCQSLYYHINVDIDQFQKIEAIFIVFNVHEEQEFKKLFILWSVQVHFKS